MLGLISNVWWNVISLSGQLIIPKDEFMVISVLCVIAMSVSYKTLIRIMGGVWQNIN